MIFVAALLILFGVLGIISGSSSMIAATQNATAELEGFELGSPSLTVLGIIILVTSVLTLLFAFGILRGSRFARMAVTILQIVALAAGIWGIFAPGAGVWQSIHSVLFPLVIITALWGGSGIREYFNR